MSTKKAQRKRKICQMTFEDYLQTRHTSFEAFNKRSKVIQLAFHEDFERYKNQREESVNSGICWEDLGIPVDSNGDPLGID